MDNKSIIIRILRRRERRRRMIEEKSFDSTAIGDLAFLLLIFFIVTASFIVRQGIFFSLPSKNAGAIKVEREKIIEIYPENNGFLYKGKLMGRDDLKQLIIDRKNKILNIILLIRMKPKVKYERLVDTLSLARETGQNRVSLKNAGDDKK